MKPERMSIPDELLPLAGFGLPLLSADQTKNLVTLYNQGVHNAKKIEGLDQNLIDAAEGDLGVLISIGNRDLLVHVASKYLDPEDDIESFFQEGLLSMHNSWSSYDPSRGDPRQYLYAVARNCAVSQYRGHKKKNPPEISLEALEYLKRYSSRPAEQDAMHNIRMENIAKKGGLGAIARELAELAKMTPAEKKGFIIGTIRRAYDFQKHAPGKGDRLSRGMQMAQNRANHRLEQNISDPSSAIEDILYYVDTSEGE